ncbi:hypothetical protein NC652_031826 [Populus alba x Populus x berolinensis]|nr:hypothetical protein NC652_031826 [Populus alba x Populus x berolinensis]
MLLAWKETLLFGERAVVAGWSSLLLVTVVVGFCCHCLAAKGKVGLCIAERVKGEQKGVKICLAS